MEYRIAVSNLHFSCHSCVLLHSLLTSPHSLLDLGSLEGQLCRNAESDSQLRTPPGNPEKGVLMKHTP
jgi:hypothetical protein